MAKKARNPSETGNNNDSNTASCFQALFGEVPDQQHSSSGSLFSDNNPFRRKLQENPASGPGFEEKAVENEGAFEDSPSAKLEVKKEKRKKKVGKQSSNLDAESLEGEGEAKSKTGELNRLENTDDGGGDFDENGKKRKKRKRDEVEADYEARRYGVVGGNHNVGEGDVVGGKRKKMDNPEDTMVSKEGFDDESKLLRTVFVGNLPLKTKKRELVKEFGKFGEVESVRIRSVPIVDGKISRKGAVIQKRFNENGDRFARQWELNLFLMKMSSVIGYGLIFLFIIESAPQSSSLEQTHNLEKFISKKYFEKYDNLMDSKFNSFIENEFTHDLTRVLQENNYATLESSVLHRNVVGEGSHRRLCSYLRFRVRPELEFDLNRQSCVVVLIERLPSGVFADPFELQHLVQRGVFTGAAVFGDTNLELPSFQSNRSVVEIHMDVASRVFSSNKNELEVTLEVPLHARYQPLGLGFSKVQFGQPDVFMCCSTERNEQNWSCSIMPTECSFSCNSSHVVWNIPCGIREHAGFVSIVTFLSCVMAVLFIVLASVRNSDNSVSNKLKHS